MTRDEWRTCDDPGPMLDLIAPLAPERSRRLFAVACCRRVARLLVDARSREAVEVSERVADGLATDAEHAAAYCGAHLAWQLLSHVFTEPLSPERPSVAESVIAAGLHPYAVSEAASAPLAAIAHVADAQEAHLAAVEAAGWASATGDRPDAGAASRERAAQADLVRDLFGDPFTAPAVDRAWLTPAALSLARAAYDEGRALPSGHLDLDRLAVLADALLEAGCDDEALLGHLRSAGPHIRGCWAIDLVLGNA